MQHPTLINPPAQLVRLLSKLQTSEIFWPGDTDVEFKKKCARLKIVAIRLNFGSDEIGTIRNYLKQVLATNDDTFMTACWRLLVGYDMSSGDGPAGRQFVSDLLKALE